MGFFLVSGRLDNRNLKFSKKNSIVPQFKALNERMSESTNLDKRFQRYLYFSIPKKAVFGDKS